MAITFADLTTMRVGGPIGRLMTASSTAEVIDLARTTDQAGEPLLVLGGGSNLIVGDVGWDGAVLKIESSDLDIRGERVIAAAGVEWDHLVQLTIKEGLSGLESLSGIPGSAGSTPIQNVGAYGSQTSDVLESLTVYDRQTEEVESWSPDRCGFGSHRESVFKHSDRWIVIDITLRLSRQDRSRPITYPELATKLGVAVGGTAGVTEVRDAVLALRRSKRMILEPSDHDTWSVGSFFLNPVVTEVPTPARGCPQYPDINGTKLSAAWLIQHSGFPPGYGLDRGNGSVALSSRHALAITNRGGATTADVLEFAAHIRDGVRRQFDILLAQECHLVNCSL